MYKLKLFLLPLARLLVFMAFACAPPDDDDRSSGPSSGPAITSASYDVGTALLTVQGTHLSPTTATQAQIQTIKVYGVVLNSYTADDPATGPDSNGLEQGKYRIANDGTAIWLKLTDQHKATLEAKPGMNKDGLKKGLLSVGSGAWAGLNTPKDLDVSNVPENKQSKVSDDNQPSKQTEEAEQAEEQSPKQPKDEQAEEVEDQQSKTETEDQQSPKQPKDEQAEEVEDQQSKTETEDQQSPKQPKDEQAEEVEDQQSKTETEDQQSPKQPKDEQAEEVEDQQSKTETEDQQSPELPEAEQTEEVEDQQSKTETEDQQSPELPEAEQTEEVEDQQSKTETEDQQSPEAAITRATYNAGTGVLVITGINLPKTVTGWDFRKLRFVAGNGRKSDTLRAHYRYATINFATGSAASTTSLTITLGGSEQRKAEAILVKNGDSDDTGAYNLEAAAGFVIGSSAADTSNNPITVSGYVVRIDKATYDVNTGELYIIGSKLPTSIAGWDFSKLTLVSGDGRKRYPLPRHATAGENTATGSFVSATGLRITLSGNVKAEVNKILVKGGKSDDAGAYNLEAAAGFVIGSSAADTTNPITVSGYVSQINNVSYITRTGVLYISGSRLPETVAEWDFSKLTLVSGDGSKRFTLPRHSTLGANRATGSEADATFLKITLSGNVKAKANAILVKAGSSDNNGEYNLEAKAEFVPGSPEDPTTSIQVIIR